MDEWKIRKYKWSLDASVGAREIPRIEGKLGIVEDGFSQYNRD